MLKITQLNLNEINLLGRQALAQMTAQPVCLSPDALMSYCQTRLRGIDTQVQTAFAKQQRDNQDSTVLSGLASGIRLPTEDPIDLSNNSPIDSVGEGAQDYVRGLADAFDKAAGSVSDPQTKAALQAQATLLRKDVTDGKKISLGDLKNATTDTVSKIQQDLNSGAELSMINLQSLMSQRQQAIQVCTNLVQNLGDQCNKIAENVGH